MAYSINPNLPRARATALKRLLVEGVPLSIVAQRAGVHRSTIWRWRQKWQLLNQYRQFDNPNRPTRPAGKSKLSTCRWSITTNSSRPHSHAWALPDDIVQAILHARETLKRCAEVAWHHVTAVLGISVSLSSVRRTLKRHHCFDGARKPRVQPSNPERPWVKAPGDLVQVDTIHHVDPTSGRKLYYYTVIDLYTRLTYVMMSTQLRQGLAGASSAGGAGPVWLQFLRRTGRQWPGVWVLLCSTAESGRDQDAT